jgi:hypothetical protein
VRIATAVDFQGSRCTNTAVMLPMLRGRCFLMPVGSIARLFKKYNGTQGVEVSTAPSGLDIVASRTAAKVYLQVANLEYRRSVEASFKIAGMKISGGRVYEIAPEDLRQYVNQDQPDVFQPREATLPSGPDRKWRFPASTVSVLDEYELSRLAPPERYVPYKGLMAMVQKDAARSARKVLPLEAVVKAVEHGMTARKPRTLYLVGANTRFWLLLNPTCSRIDGGTGLS